MPDLLKCQANEGFETWGKGIMRGFQGIEGSGRKTARTIPPGSRDWNRKPEHQLGTGMPPLEKIVQAVCGAQAPVSEKIHRSGLGKVSY